MSAFRALLQRGWAHPLPQRILGRTPRVIQYGAWHCLGRRTPAPAGVKQQIVRIYGRRFGLSTLVETGTYLGEMLEAMRGHFSELYSVELDPELHRRARARFARYSHIHLLQGDSGVVLEGLLEQIDTPCLFWLDGHWSGGDSARGGRETPIRAEAEAIVRHRRTDHVILIDDARCFNGEGDYPTLEEVKRIFCGLRSDLKCEVRDDIVRITPWRGTRQ